MAILKDKILLIIIVGMVMVGLITGISAACAAEPEFVVLMAEIIEDGTNVSLIMRETNTGACYQYIGATPVRPVVIVQIECPI